MNNSNTNSKNIIHWILGAIGIAWVLVFIMFFKYSILFYHGLPYVDFFRRGFFVLLFCASLCLFRIFRGPTPSDRLVAIEILGILIVGFCALISIPTGRGWYINISIAWALQSFIISLALSKYLEGKGFDE